MRVCMVACMYVCMRVCVSVFMRDMMCLYAKSNVDNKTKQIYQKRCDIFENTKACTIMFNSSKHIENVQHLLNTSNMYKIIKKRHNYTKHI